MIDWHFPRNALAKQYLDLLKIGISSNLAIIAPRRKGKTLFILQDLSPLALKNGYVPVYASLWQNPNAPQEGLITSLEESIDVFNKRSRIANLFHSKIKKTTVGNELLGKMEIEFADTPEKPTSKELAYLEKLLAQLERVASKKTVLLLIDEIQHLSTSPIFDPLTHTLRTMLDKRQGKVKAIFTGSSRHYMNLLFNESQSPFYHFVENVPFPDFGEDFISFLREKLEKDYAIHTSNAPLLKAFNTFDQSPYWMMKFIARIITYKSSEKEATDHVLSLMEVAEGFEGLSNKLKPIDRIIFLSICNGISPFSNEVLAKIDQESDVKGIAPNVQRALQRLKSMHLISQLEKGTYHVEKPGLKQYLLAKE